MKILSVVLALILLAAPSQAAGRKVALVGTSDAVGTVAALDAEDRDGTDLPADAVFGYYKETFTLFFVPLVSWGGSAVISSESEETIWELEGESLAYFEDKYGPADAGHTGWMKWCNFVTPVVVLLLGFLKFRGGSNEDDEE